MNKSVSQKHVATTGPAVEHFIQLVCVYTECKMRRSVLPSPPDSRLSQPTLSMPGVIQTEDVPQGTPVPLRDPHTPDPLSHQPAPFPSPSYSGQKPGGTLVPHSPPHFTSNTLVRPQCVFRIHLEPHCLSPPPLLPSNPKPPSSPAWTISLLVSSLASSTQQPK